MSSLERSVPMYSRSKDKAEIFNGMEIKCSQSMKCCKQEETNVNVFI